MSDPNVERADESLEIRQDQAQFQRNLPLPDHPTNGDENAFPNKIASYSKGLPHNDLGEVSLPAYQSLIKALESGKPDDFEAIILGESNLSKRRKLVNPQSGLAFDLEGSDSHHLTMIPAPTFSSAQEAGEIVENYWMALTRDVPFTAYSTDPLIDAATKDLSKLSDFHGPKINGKVTAGTIFRGFVPDDLIGPYVSQFLLKTALFGAEVIEQKITTTPAGSDFMTNYDAWLSVQRGTQPAGPTFDPTPRFIRNGRDIGQYVHIDVLFQSYFDACLILAAKMSDGGVGAPLNPGNPYVKSQTQEGFATFGPPHIKGLLGEIAVRALHAVWYQKWFVHRRLRPEVFAGRIHNRLTKGVNYPIQQDVLNSDALQRVHTKNGTYLLPMAFPEGSPLHPAYGAGHATAAGACVTVLKWFFDETAPVQNPMVPNSDGTKLIPYTGPGADKLTVRIELNKLAANIALGRNFAGVHWRSDYSESLKLGEMVAIRALQDFKETVNEKFDGGVFTKFDGTQTRV